MSLFIRLLICLLFICSFGAYYWFTFPVATTMRDYIARPSGMKLEIAMMKGGAKQKNEGQWAIMEWANVKFDVLPENARMLVKYGGDVNKTDDMGYNAAMIANYATQKLPVLLELGINPNTVAFDGLTALESLMIDQNLLKANKAQYQEHIKLLLTYGANPCLTTRESGGKRNLIELARHLNDLGDDMPLKTIKTYSQKCD